MPSNTATYSISFKDPADIATEIDPRDQVLEAWSASFGGQLIQDEGKPFSLELCCGTANLSGHLKAKGFQVAAVDWSVNRHAPRTVVSLHRSKLIH